MPGNRHPRRIPTSAIVRACRRRAFTLVELIAVVVILGLLIAATAFGYSRIVAGSHNETAELTLAQVAKGAAAAAAVNGQLLFTEDAFTAAVADATVAAPAPGGEAPLAAAGYTLATGGPSTDPATISVDIAGDGGSAGLALLSDTGDCAVATVTGAKVHTAVWEGDQGANCAGEQARIHGASDGTGPGYAAPAPPPSMTVASVTAYTNSSTRTIEVRWAETAGATGYRVYLDGTQAGTVTGQATTTYVITGLAAPASPRTYQVTVAAADASTVHPASAPVSTVLYPFNDMWANAWPIRATSAAGTSSMNYTHNGATIEPSEQSGKPSVWFKFTAPADGGTYRMTLSPMPGNTNIEVYQNSTSAATGAHVAYKWYYDAQTTTFTATPGRTYMISVNGYVNHNAALQLIRQ